MAPTIVLSKEFGIDNLTFSDLKTMDNGGKMVYVSYKSAPFIMQTPAMSVPFGLSVWDNDGKATPKYTLDLSFKGMDTSKKLQKFYDVLEALDKRLVDHGFANQTSWFKGKKYGSREIVDALYTPLIKYAKDRETGERTDKYPPTFKVSVPFRNDAFACQVFDMRQKSVDLDKLETKGATATAIIQCSGVWFAGGKFGVSWRAVQLQIVPNDMSIRGFAISGDEDDEVLELDNNHNNDNDAVSSSDSEEDPEDMLADF